MTYNYPEMETINKNGLRLYKTPEGVFYPSITTVLGNTTPEEKKASLEKWRTSLGHAAADKKTKEAADHGTAVHLLIERFLKGEELVKGGEQFEQRAITAFNALRLSLKKIDQVWCQEAPLYSDLLGVAGRTDCIGTWLKTPAIIDFKTSTRVKTDKEIEDYKLQLCAYSIMHNEKYGTEIEKGVILMSAGTGFPLIFVVHLPDYAEKLIERVDHFYSTIGKTLHRD